MVKIIIDSASDISESEAKSKGAVLVSMEINIDGKQYLDGVDLTPHQFFEKLVECTDLPTTSQINEYRWNEVFEKVTANGDEAVVITLSSKLSGTYNSAAMAAKSFKGKVFVVDSLNACVGERLLFDLAQRLIKEGKSAFEVAEILEEKKHKIELLALLGTLKYLKKGGRISPLVAFAGELLGVKPVIAIKGGEVKLVGKARGSKNGNNLLMNLVETSGGIDYDMPYYTGYSGLDDSVLQKYIADSVSLWEGKTSAVPVCSIGSTIGTHIGPGAIGVAFFRK